MGIACPSCGSHDFTSSGDHHFVVCSECATSYTLTDEQVAELMEE